jgi:hypothetical protein
MKYLLLLAILLPLPAHSLPFLENPVAFELWLDQRTWKGGESVKFFNLHRCVRYGCRRFENYVCRAGYVKVQNEQGRFTCNLSEVLYREDWQTGIADYNFRVRNCYR